MLSRLRNLYHEFPQRFWIIVGVSFIDRIGGTLIFPFFSLYITQHFKVGMTEAGVVLGLFSAFGLLGGILGGALTDKFGRRKLILFGLIASAFSSLALGLVSEFYLLLPLAAVVGTLLDIAGPAHGAMIADVLPEAKRQEGFGVLRVMGNLAWIIGPTIGGFLANTSFFVLFASDAVISCVVALLFARLIPETQPAPTEVRKTESLFTTFAGYRRVLSDGSFIAFIVACILMGSIYQQMYNALPVYLRDQHGITPQGYGLIMSLGAIIVILFQFWVTRRLKRYPAFLLMAVGTLFYLVGFGLFGWVGAFAWFALAIFIITLGEMIVEPTTQAIAVNFATAEMRGRYMAVFSFSYFIPATFAPSLAGIILDNYDPNWLWHLGAILCAVAALAFYALHLRLGAQPRFAGTPQPTSIPAEAEG